jgi:glycosyltransferase involved in cell wall biosynthesis
MPAPSLPGAREQWVRGLLRSRAVGVVEKSLRIAQIAPLFESVPPKLYGGTERVVSYLTEALVRQGHQVTLFASGDSSTGAELVSGCDRAIRLDSRHPDPGALHLVMLEKVFQRASSFDVIHCHLDTGAHLPLARRSRVPVITTLHGRLDVAGLDTLYAEFSDMPLVSISDSQRRPLPHAGWAATIHHGLPTALHRPSFTPGSYLAFLGRVSPEKGLDRAISIAQRAGMPLKIAAKVDRADEHYFRSHVQPLLEAPGIEFVGEIGEADKASFLGGAAALLFPIGWPEPFGLAMIEAMACGTPVIAFRCGSVPEVVDDGVTGFIVDNEDEAVACVTQARQLDRKACRSRFEDRFSDERQAREYVSLFKRYGGARCQLRA